MVGPLEPVRFARICYTCEKGGESVEAAVRLYISEIGERAAVQLCLAERYAGCKMEEEKRFETGPTFTSYLVFFPVPLDEAVYAFLEQLKAKHMFAWYELAEKSASLRWMYDLLPREEQWPIALQAILHLLEVENTYEIRLLDRRARSLRLSGINDKTGVTSVSPEQQSAVAALRFPLQPGERLLFWCRKRQGEQEAVARALFSLSQEGRMEIEAVEGLEVHLAQRSLLIS